MTVVYFDCEFTDLIDIETDNKLISAGFVGPSGKELYFELTCHYMRDECNDFVIEAVLPHLNAAKHGMPAQQAAYALKDWIEGFNEQVYLATDAPAWDWPLIYDLLIDHKIWPVNLLSQPKGVNSDRIQQNYEHFFKRQPTTIRHHALCDARALAYAAEIENQQWIVEQ